MNSVDLSIVIVTYKEDLSVLKTCFDAVQASEGISYELIVIDNGSSDTTRGLLQSYKEVTYLRNTSNKGFAAAVNRGLSIARGRYVLLLNPDTTFSLHVLERIVGRLDADTSVGIASCLIRYPNGEIQESIRRFPTLLDQVLILCKLPHIFSRLKPIDRYMMRDTDPQQVLDVDSIMGAFMFIRREVIEQIGYLDERYFIWFEEVDYCKMAHDANWSIRHFGDIEIVHHKGHMFGKLATWQKQKWIRESLRKYMRKQEGLGAWLLLWVLTPLFLFLAILASMFKKR